MLWKRSASLCRVGKWILVVVTLCGCKGRCERELQSRLGEHAIRDLTIEICSFETQDYDTRIYSLEAILRTELSTAEIAAKLNLRIRDLPPAAVLLAEKVGSLTVKEEFGEIVDGAARFDGGDWVVLKKVASGKYRLSMRGVPEPEGR